MAVVAPQAACPPTPSQPTRAGRSSATTRSRGLNGPPKVNARSAPTATPSARAPVVHQPAKPSVVVSASKTVSRGARISNR
jgi:hypothetical protein